MLKNYLMTAWRNILKNKLYAAINIVGLVVGLGVYLFSSLLADYEHSHDMIFANAGRIFTVGSIASPTANIGVSQIDAVYSAVGPLIEADVPEIEAVARTVRSDYLISVGEDDYYQTFRFADPELLKIFDLTYLEGDDQALEDPSGLLLTESAAKRLFGDKQALGQIVTLDHNVELHVTAVVRDLPQNTHFNSSLVIENRFEAVAPIAALNAAADYEIEGNWSNLSMGNLTYLLVPPDKRIEWVQAKMDGIYDSHFPEDQKPLVSSFRVVPLAKVNTLLWDAIGLPVIEIIQFLGILVLIVAIVNYTNLATAQSLGRAREVGLRKTMGANQRQLLVQFMVESLTIATISMFVALALLEAVVPLFNNVTDRVLNIDYIVTVPWLILTTLVVGTVAGAYPAYLITQATPIEALREGGARGVKGGRFRSIMLGVQFTISIFMLAMVLIVYLQNAKIETSSKIYPKDQVLTLQRLNVDYIRERLESLRNELKQIPGVTSVTYSSQVPFDQSNSLMQAGPVAGDETRSFRLNSVVIDHEFLTTYDVPLLAGRDLSQEIAGDTLEEEESEVNVIVNELAVTKLGFGSPGEALNRQFYDFPTDREKRVYTIVGVTPDQNFLGFFNEIKPMVFYARPQGFFTASLRIKAVDVAGTLDQVGQAWDRVLPDYPIQTQFLDENFESVFQIFSAMTMVLTGFAIMALTLSMIGLFGLAAFMAARRTKEIGIRKVMGASLGQIVRMLIWQFSVPVIWALVIALPISYYAADRYLSFFADRLDLTEAIVLGAGALAVIFSWAVVSVHAVQIARASPIMALRYE